MDKTIIVLAMHGLPPQDYPPHELMEFFGLHARLETAHTALDPALEHRYGELDAKLRAWPRTPQNDPFYVGSYELAQHLEQLTGCEVIVGFNEFCGPNLDQALDQAVALEATRVMVITPMMTPGGSHSEQDLPAAIARAQARHSIPFLFAWPFDIHAVAQFLATHLERFS